MLNNRTQEESSVLNFFFLVAFFSCVIFQFLFSYTFLFLLWPWVLGQLCLRRAECVRTFVGERERERERRVEWKKQNSSFPFLLFCFFIFLTSFFLVLHINSFFPSRLLILLLLPSSSYIFLLLCVFLVHHLSAYTFVHVYILSSSTSSVFFFFSWYHLALFHFFLSLISSRIFFYLSFIHFLSLFSIEAGLNDVKF